MSWRPPPLLRSFLRIRVRAPVLLVGLVFLLVGTPLLEGTTLRSVTGGFTVGLLVVAIYTVSRSLRTLVVAVALGLPAVVGGIWHLLPWHDVPRLQLVFLIVFFAFLVTQYFRYLLAPTPVDTEKLASAANLYLLIGVTWALLFRLVLSFWPDALRIPEGTRLEPGDVLYFSFVTLTTLGYGDITPAHPVMQGLTALEAASGTFFVSVVVARLVSLFGAEVDQAGPEADADSDAPA